MGLFEGADIGAVSKKAISRGDQLATLGAGIILLISAR